MPSQNPISPNNNIPPEEMYRQPGAFEHGKKNWFALHHVLAFLLFGLLAAATVMGVYLWQVSQFTTGIPTVFHHAKKDPTADWKTYTNSQYSFEIQYPGSWDSYEVPMDKYYAVVFQSPDPQEIEPGSKVDPWLNVTVYSKDSDIPPIKDQFQAQESEIQTSHKKVTVDGQTQTEDDYKSFVVEGSYQITHQVKINKNSKIYVIDLAYIMAGCAVQIPPHDICDAENVKLADTGEKIWTQALATFKFTSEADGTSSGANNWKTFINVKYDFQIKYPGDWKASITGSVFKVEKSANCYGTLTFGGKISPVWYKNNVYDTVTEGQTCDDTLNAIFKTYKPNADTQSGGSVSCTQVITRAKNNKTGEIKDFPTPCDVPDGWTLMGPASAYQ
jgi:hypothetical protein